MEKGNIPYKLAVNAALKGNASRGGTISILTDGFGIPSELIKISMNRR